MHLQDFCLKIGNSSIITGGEDGVVLGLEGTMKGLQISTKFQPCNPLLNFTLNLDGLSIRSKFPVLTLRSLIVNSKVSCNLCLQVLLIGSTLYQVRRPFLKSFVLLCRWSKAFYKLPYKLIIFLSSTITKTGSRYCVIPITKFRDLSVA